MRHYHRRMPLSPEQEWTLVACGLIAHADGILEIGEWDQVLWMVEERLPEADVAKWLEVLADRERLRAEFARMVPPPPFFAETILERAWRMGLADGKGSDEEAAVHDEIATKLGADLAEVAKWRELWRVRAEKRSELVAGFAAVLANADAVADSGERATYDDLIASLPLAPGRAEEMASLIDSPPSVDELAARVAGLDAEERRITLLSLVPVVRASFRGDAEREAFLSLATRVAVARADAERMLDR